MSTSGTGPDRGENDTPDRLRQGPYQQNPYQPGGYAPQQYHQPPYNPDGYNQYPSQAYTPQKPRVLGILFGAFGIHRLYLGHIGVGIVMLLLSTVGAVLTVGLTAVAAGIWGLVEGIVILVGSEHFRRDARGVPLRD